MKILIVNKFYYHRGGDCTAVFSLEQLLRSKGHQTAIFSVKHPQNEFSPWEAYFPSNVDFSTSGLSGKVAAATRIFHSSEVARKFNALLSDFRPDIVHLHNIHSYLSPLVAQIAHRKGRRVVWTLHDQKLLCPTYLCLRNGTVCEECISHKSRVIKYKCMKDSHLASALGWLEICYWHRRKLSGLTDLFISPSRFLKEQMIKGGYNSDQIRVLPNFLPLSVEACTQKEDYYCYVGRLSPEKGTDTLLETATRMDYPLKVIGDGPLLDTYQRKYRQAHIQFLGRMKPENLFPIVQKARFLVLPSICYENNPYSVIEALCMGTPVLGSRIGGIPELIEEEMNGFLFTPGNTSELGEKIEKCMHFFTNNDSYEKIANDAQNKFSPEAFYKKLITIYDH